MSVTVAAVATTGRTFLLPDLGEGLTEAEVIEWLVAPGDEVHVDQIVVTVETAKASVELPCPYAGSVLTLDSAPGVVLQVGAPLLTIGAPQPTVGTPLPTVGTRPEEVTSEASGSGNVLVGYGTSEKRRSGRRRVTSSGGPAGANAHASVIGPVSGSAKRAAPAPATQPEPATAAPAATAPRVISPVVRKLARDNRIDVAGLAPTGPGQIIRRADVETALRAGSGTADTTGTADTADTADTATAATAATAATDTAFLREVTTAAGAACADRAGDIRIPLRGVRRAIAEKMATSRREIPEASVWVDVDATGLMAAKDEIRAIDPAAGIGLLALLARICVAGLSRFPELNARVDLEAQEIVQLAGINLSFAAQSPRGLVVPVAHGAGEMTTSELAATLRELTQLARDGRLSPAQMTGGTFTLNNYGVFGTDGATPIINYPEAAMLGVGRIIDRPWAHEGQLALRKVAQLGLTFDHRVCDGGTAGGFLRFVADCVEKPALLLTEL